MSNITYETDANGNSVKVTTTPTGAVLREIDRPAPAPVAKIRADAFWDRFTQSELVAYEVACQHNPADTQANQNRSAKLRIFRREADNMGMVDLANAKVQSKMNGLMITESILTAPRATTILTTPITADEAA